MGLVTQLNRKAQDRGGLVVILLVLAIACNLIQKPMTEDVIKELILSYYESIHLRVTIGGIKLEWSFCLEA